MRLGRSSRPIKFEDEVEDARIKELRDRKCSRVSAVVKYEPEIKPYDWAEDEKDFDTQQQGSLDVPVIQINSYIEIPAINSEQAEPSKKQRVVNTLKYTRALASTFVEVIKEAYLPTDQLEEARRLSEEEGISTVIHFFKRN